MSTLSEFLVILFGPSIGYDSSVLSFPTGLCTTCQRALYKIRNQSPETLWNGPHPPAWDKFSATRIYGVRKCGSVKGNSIGNKGSKAEIGRFVAGHEVPQKPETSVKGAWCQECCQSTGQGIPHSCTPANRKKDIVNCLEN